MVHDEHDERGSMRSRPAWHERPGPTIAVGFGLLVVCGLCAWAGLADDTAIARPAGLVTGGAGIYLLVGGILSWRDDHRGAQP
jgi:hypothetical protein